MWFQRSIHVSFGPLTVTLGICLLLLFHSLFPVFAGVMTVVMYSVVCIEYLQSISNVIGIHSLSASFYYNVKLISAPPPQYL